MSSDVDADDIERRVNRVSVTWRTAVENIVQTGRFLIEDKLELGHGNFLKILVPRLPFSERTAQMLMKIAEHPVISNPHHGAYLPASWRTLAELATLPPILVEAKIKDGTINAGMERNDVYRLKPGHAEAQHSARMTPINKLNQEHEAQVADLEERLAAAEARAEAAGETKSDKNHGAGNSEWNTPPEYIELARSVLGKIDVDPASNSVAQQTVQAATFYTKQDDGLTKDWMGTVWCNPPASMMAEFAEKMVNEIDDGNVSAAIMLANNYTESPWFHLVSSRAAGVCFTWGRIKFNPAEERERPGFASRGQIFFYFGPDSQAFERAFRDIGLIWRLQQQHPAVGGGIVEQAVARLVMKNDIVKQAVQLVLQMDDNQRRDFFGNCRVQLGTNDVGNEAGDIADAIIGMDNWTKAVAVAAEIYRLYELVISDPNSGIEPVEKPKRGRRKGSKSKPKPPKEDIQ